MQDVKEKFMGKAENYAAARTGYSQELVDEMLRLGIIFENSKVADVGSGTGKFAKQLLEIGCEVHCVEPNADMRNMAISSLSGFDKVHFVSGSAEDTLLESGKFDLVTAAQAFHWFDVPKFRSECKRILKNDGYVALLWNTRDVNSKLISEMYDVFKKYCPDFKGFSNGMKDDSKICEFFTHGFKKLSFKHDIYYSKDGFVKRCLSSSYSLNENDPHYPDYLAALSCLYEKYSENNTVCVNNYSVVYYGRL